jgi:serine/threonine protein phosphatase PrpC
MGILPRILGASVAGPLKSKEGLENQDAILALRNRQFSLAVVCDGMGSKKYSSQGAKAATVSVNLALQNWMVNGNRVQERLLKLIHQDWNIRIEQYGGREAATTCLFACIDNQGNGIAAQLGDGLIAWTREGKEINRLEEKNREFINETTGLGIAKDLKSWRTFNIEGFRKGDAIFLLSDGISEALEPSDNAGFLYYLKQTYCKWPFWLRRRRLIKSLKDWPNPAHVDDKSVCIIWS